LIARGSARDSEICLKEISFKPSRPQPALMSESSTAMARIPRVAVE
jgi:hypothetical protein